MRGQGVRESYRYLRGERKKGVSRCVPQRFPVPESPLVCPRPFSALLPVSLTFTIGECSPAADAIMKPPRTYRTLHTGDLDPEAHVDLLLARISCDLRVMYEPPDLSTPETAARAVVMLDRLLATIESHHREIKALRNHLQEKGRRLTWPRKTRPTPRGRSAHGRGTRPRCGAVRWRTLAKALSHNR